jgi:hypothetical protein
MGPTGCPVGPKVRPAGQELDLETAGVAGSSYNHPFCRAIRAASTRFSAPSLLMASER